MEEPLLNDKKYIAPKEPGANILKWAFHTIAKGQYQVEQIYKEVNNKGFTVCKSGFWNLLRNPVYCGKILTCGYRELHKTYVPGQHEAIISEALFNEVQDFLDGKKKNYRTKVGSLEVLQLRGFIKCPRCGKLLTGSALRGHGGLYYYYHCSASCGSRFKSEQANELFAGELKKYIPRPGMTEVFKLVINEVYLSKTKNQKDEIKNIKTELEHLNSRLVKGRELLLSGDLDGADYKEIKSESEKKIAYLEAKALDLNRGTTSIAALLDKALNGLARLDTLYAEADTKRKREIIGSMYPEKLTFDGMGYRTSRLNEAVELIYNLGEGFSENKKGQISQKTELSSLVVLHRHFSNHFIPGATITSFATDKDGNMVLTIYNSSNPDLYKNMADKSFIRLFHWTHKSNYPQIDGINDNASMLDPKSMVVRDNGDIYFIDNFSIRKMSFE